MEIDFCDNSLSALRCYLAIQLCHLFTENHKEVKILPGWIFVPSKHHLIRTVAEGGGGGSDSVRREPGVGGANLRRRLWILSQAEGLAVGD